MIPIIKNPYFTYLVITGKDLAVVDQEEESPKKAKKSAARNTDIEVIKPGDNEISDMDTAGLYILYTLEDHLKSFYRDKSIYFEYPDIQNPVAPHVYIQWYVSPVDKTVYIEYEYDRRFKSCVDTIAFTESLNNRLNKNMREDIFMKPEILFPEDNSNSGRRLQGILSPWTVGYWTLRNGMTRFIEDESITRDVFKLEKLKSIKKGIHYNDWEVHPNVKKFFNGIGELNEKYDLKPNIDKGNLPEAFKDFQRLYVDCFNKEVPNMIGEFDNTFAVVFGIDKYSV